MSGARKVALVLAAIAVTAVLWLFLGLLPGYVWVRSTTETTTITVLQVSRHTTEPWGPSSRTTVTAENETWIIAYWTSTETMVWTIWQPSVVVTITHFDTLTVTVYLQRTTGPAQTVTVTTTVTQR